MVMRLGNDYDSPKHISFIIPNSLISPNDLGACWPIFSLNDYTMCGPWLYTSEDDTIGDLKKLISAQTGTRYDKIVLKKWQVFLTPYTNIILMQLLHVLNYRMYSDVLKSKIKCINKTFLVDNCNLRCVWNHKYLQLWLCCVIVVSSMRKWPTWVFY